jgi:hypothetical protein
VKLIAISEPQAMKKFASPSAEAERESRVRAVTFRRVAVSDGGMLEFVVVYMYVLARPRSDVACALRQAHARR